MARKTSVTLDNLKQLGAERLAALVMEEAGRNPGFKRQVSAALASQAGPEAVAKIVDRRVSALERARSFIEWDKARAFSEDLRSLVSVIEAELVPTAPAIATDRLLRFIATHEQVFDRIDDSNGSVQDVYYRAIERVGESAARLDPTEAELLPGRIMACLGETSHGYLLDVAEAVVPHLPDPALAAWDADLERRIGKRGTKDAETPAMRRQDYMSSQWDRVRQLIAGQRGNIDLLVEIELKKPDHMRNTAEIAEKLLEAGRAGEALDWVRRTDGRQRMRAASGIDYRSPGRVALEARILDALGDEAAARSVLWDGFARSLSVDLLRAHLETLPDFEDMEAEDRAMDLALGHRDPLLAVQFFLDWPRRDLAAKAIVLHAATWDGGDWYVLPEIAASLEHDYPLAATILYRALIEDILTRARSKAYGHGARHLRQLGLIAKEAEADPAWQAAGLESHPTYLEGLKSAHGRKSGFWASVKKYAV